MIFRAAEGGVSAITDAMGFGADAEDFVNAYKTDGKLDFGLENATMEDRVSTMAIRRFMLSKASGESGISLSDGLDLVGLAGHPILELWHLAAEAEKRDKPVSFDGIAMRAANMIFGGTYTKAWDALVGGQAPVSKMTSRYTFSDPIAGEEETYIKGAIRKVTGVGWQPLNVHKRGKKYFDRLEQRWGDTLVAPITNDIRKLARMEEDSHIGPDARAEARDRRKNATRLKDQMQDIIKREIHAMWKEHQVLIKNMHETKTTKEEPLPPGTPGRAGTLNVIQGAR